MIERLTDRAIELLANHYDFMEGVVEKRTLQAIRQLQADLATVTAERDAMRAAFPIAYGIPTGATREEMRAWLRDTPEGQMLYRRGDCLLVWVNEGDLHMQAFAALGAS